MMTAVRQTATVQADGRLNIAVPELPPGTVADVIVLVPSETPTAQPEPTIAERLAALHELQASVNLSDADVENWKREIRLERLAWQLPGDGEP